jgi:hypothetical protein
MKLGIGYLILNHRAIQNGVISAGGVEMSEFSPNTAKIAKVFTDYCEGKKYQVKVSEETSNLRIDISNLSERTIVKIFYTTDTIQLQGKQNSLKLEMQTLKEKFETDPQGFLREEIVEIKGCVTRYDIMLPELRRKIKESLTMLEGKIEIFENPSSAIEYRAKITGTRSSLTLTQFRNGTLMVQGRTDKLFDDGCDLFEKIANPSDKEVIARFISCDEKNLETFAARYTPKLITLAEANVINKVGKAYTYLDPHDQKWFTASECLCLTKIPLPEYSPLVMPASKAFEGFAKKLLVGIGLFEADHFKTKNANFSVLNDEKNPKRITICKKEKYAGTMLERISLCLDTNRNFMMHSDESRITKVDSQQAGEGKVDNIFRDTKEIFDYFNDLYTLLPK